MLIDRYEIAKLDPFWTDGALRYYVNLGVFLPPTEIIQTKANKRLFWEREVVIESFERVKFYRANRPPSNNKVNRAMKELNRNKQRESSPYDMAMKLMKPRSC